MTQHSLSLPTLALASKTLPDALPVGLLPADDGAADGSAADGLADGLAADEFAAALAGSRG